MNINLRGKDFPAKNLKEGDNNGGNITKGSSSSRTWIGLKDPRIVRVSRSSGGKDRHSKVRTIRGLRDRRIRLSIPTAIQLYDLQERLGLDQPSKAVDWLLNAAKHEIDELPPLQILPGIFSQNPPESSLGRVVDANTEYVKDDLNVFKIISNGVGEEDQATSPKSTPWNSDSPLSSTKGKEIRETKEHGSQEGIEVLNNVTHPYNSYNPWDPSNPSSPLPSFFPSYVTNPSLECEPKQINQFQMLNPSSQNLLSNSLYSVGNLPMRPPFNFNRTPRLLHSQNDIGSQPNKGNTSSSNAFI